MKTRVINLFTDTIHEFDTLEDAYDFIDESGNHMVVIEEDKKRRVW